MSYAAYDDDGFLYESVLTRRVAAWCVDLLLIGLLVWLAWLGIVLLGILTLGVGFLLLAALGLSAPLCGVRLLPIGTLYDPFINLGLDALNYACYQDARFILVATPSGLTLAPEGGAHQSIGTPLIGMAQDGLAAFEPAFVEMRRIIDSGRLGRLGALATWAFTPWAIRPREPQDGWIDFDREVELRQIRERSISERAVDAAAADADLQAVGNFQMPKARNPSPGCSDQPENRRRCIGPLIGVDPAERSRTVEHQAHRRPSSRQAIASSSVIPSLSVLARSRSRSTAVTARSAACASFRPVTSSPPAPSSTRRIAGFPSSGSSRSAPAS